MRWLYLTWGLGDLGTWGLGDLGTWGLSVLPIHPLLVSLYPFLLVSPSPRLPLSSSTCGQVHAFISPLFVVSLLLVSLLPTPYYMRTHECPLLLPTPRLPTFYSLLPTPYFLLHADTRMSFVTPYSLLPTSLSPYFLVSLPSRSQ